MAVFEDKVKALIGAVVDSDITPGEGFGLPIAQENVKYDSSDGEPYLELFDLPAPTVQASLGAEGCDNHSGIFQIDINYQANEGRAVLDQKADEINAVIKSGATFTENDVNVRIQNVSVQRLPVNNGYATLSMTIEYFAFTKRL